VREPEKTIYPDAKRYDGGFKNRNLKIDKPLAQTFLVKKVRYRNATLVTSPVKDTNES
jgi:hypothetical protein